MRLTIQLLISFFIIQTFLFLIIIIINLNITIIIQMNKEIRDTMNILFETTNKREEQAKSCFNPVNWKVFVTSMNDNSLVNKYPRYKAADFVSKTLFSKILDVQVRNMTIIIGIVYLVIIIRMLQKSLTLINLQMSQNGLNHMVQEVQESNITISMHLIIVLQENVVQLTENIDGFFLRIRMYLMI